MTITVLIADDHAFTLEGMQHALQEAEGIEVCACADNGVAAIAKARICQPDVALLDFAMADATGLEVFAEIQRWSPATRALVVTGNTRPEVLDQIVKSGISGLCTKGCRTETVVQAIRDVARGERVITDAAQALIRQVLPGPARQLTAREHQVLQAITRGLTNTEIGVSLGISPKTVDSHRMSLMRKLDVNSAPALVLQAIRLGLVDT